MRNVRVHYQSVCNAEGNSRIKGTGDTRGMVPEYGDKLLGLRGYKDTSWTVGARGTHPGLDGQVKGM